jgi:hypothetical protein
MPIILAIQEAELWKIVVGGQPEANSSKEAGRGLKQ